VIAMTNNTITESIQPSMSAEASASLTSRQLGFWLYLMSDAILFALLFATYVTMRHNLAGGPDGQALFDLSHSFGETLLLLSSSLTCGLAILVLPTRRTGLATLWLGITCLLGAGFLTMELSEFTGMLQQGAGPDRSGFLSAFFTLVGTHGLHVSFGLLWALVMIVQLQVKGAIAPVVSRLKRWSLFWHFLDIVWIGIFSIVYLPGIYGA
jgi:cytochrome o ubiquinol oxidase subunit 3